jgi:hypothetical protein
MQISSHRTMTIFCPASSSLATMLQRRPSRWSRPSMTFVAVSTMVVAAAYQQRYVNTHESDVIRQGDNNLWSRCCSKAGKW